MESGRELNKLIAEKVMGLEVIKTEYNKGQRFVYSLGQPYYYDFAGDLQLANPLPDYSQDLTAAMEVFDKLRNSHEYCCLKISSDHNYIWTVSLIKSQDWRRSNKVEEEYKHEPSIVVDEESLPLAICLAALRTVTK